MSEEDVLTLKAAVLHLLNEAGGALDKYRIYKSLYFANKEHLNRYGRMITSDVFFALPLGPVPTKLANVLDYIQGKKRLSASDKKMFKPIIDSVKSCQDDADSYFTTDQLPDLDELSESDVECLNLGLKKCMGVGFEKIKNESHDAAWKKASKKPSHRSINVLDMVEDPGMKEFVLDNMYSC